VAGPGGGGAEVGLSLEEVGLGFGSSGIVVIIFASTNLIEEELVDEEMALLDS
jgi:hypothetical protein